MDLEMDLLATGNSPYRAFNSAVSELNTPDITADLDIGKILAADNIDTRQHTAMETREDVWGHESFDIFSTLEYGLCLPATLVEGSLADSQDSLTVAETDPVALEECENIDLLQWIVEDQHIDPLAASEVAQPEQPAETTRVSVIVPVSSPSTSFYINTLEHQDHQEHQEEVKVKLEPLGEDEKPEQRGQQEVQGEQEEKSQGDGRRIGTFGGKNQKLKETFESMEREVKAMKRRLLSNISSK